MNLTKNGDEEKKKTKDGRQRKKTDHKSKPRQGLCQCLACKGWKRKGWSEEKVRDSRKKETKDGRLRDRKMNN